MNALRPVPRACQKRLPTHRLLPCGLHFIQDEKPASRANRGLTVINKLLSCLCLSSVHYCMGTMDFEQRSIEIHERAGPRMEGAHVSLQFFSGTREIKPTFLFFQH